ncbi:hypothetical protein [Streptomyces sp. NBC_00996]|uniref:hypothetical protein n=1 Tax=Streptomyces sp. NBC_00996 TaxID=2903710 RepID=UPI00386872A5|nr:hypothetical protein OG390_48575 [Streptomyces sp. NBC_00996]
MLEVQLERLDQHVNDQHVNDPHEVRREQQMLLFQGLEAMVATARHHEPATPVGARAPTGR